MSRRTDSRGVDFHRGILAALAVVAAHNPSDDVAPPPTLYEEIVDSAGADRLVAALESAEDAEWTGMLRFGYVTPQRLGVLRRRDANRARAPRQGRAAS